MKEFDINSFDFGYLLLEYAKEFKISEDELILILMIDHILKGEPRSLVTPDQLSLKLSMPLTQIDAVLSKLNHRSLITHIKYGKSLYTSLKPLHLLLRERVVAEILRVDEIEANREMSEALENTYSIFERETGRPLTSVEMNQIHNWLKKYNKDEILDALYETKDIRKTKITIKNVDKTLFDRAVKNDRKAEGGKSTLSDKNDLTMKEAAEAAKLEWID